YTLAISNDVTAPKTTAAAWSFNNNVATYKNTSVSAGYTLANNQIVYSAASGGETCEVKGVKDTKGLSINGKVVTVAASALNAGNVTISDGYTLAISNDVTAPKTTAAAWSINGSTATYKKNSTSDGYTVNANNEIVYSSASEGDTLVTVRGVQSTNGLSLNKKVVTVSKVALGTDEVTISDGYILKLGGDVTKSATTNTWKFNESKATATYKQTATKGYALADDKKSITYTKTKNKDLITVSGVKSASELVVDDDKKVVTVGAKALNKKKVTVSDGFTLKLGGGVATPETASANWVHNGTTATYKSSSTSAGYSTSSDGKSITYSTATASSTLATITGVKTDFNPTPRNKVITLKKANLSGSKVTVSGNYGFNFAKGDYKKTLITGSKNKDSITSNGSKLSITGGKGNDLISLSSDAKNNVIVYNNGDGNDTIYGFDGNDTLKITSGTAATSVSGNDVIFTVGKGKITVKNAKGKTFNYIDADSTKTYPKSKIVTLTEDYDKKTYTMGKELRTLDASAVQRDLEITGNEFANKIIGSDQNDIIKGGKANDTLAGGKGSDVFVYAKGDGNDVITDYTEDDIIRITKGTATVKKEGNNVIFTVGTGKLTVKNAKSKVVTYKDANGKVNYYPKDQNSAVTVSGAGVTLQSGYKKSSFDVANYGNNIVTIDASPVSHDLKIFGNEKTNVILGGYGNDTIYGGKNNDTLQGGDGKNVFVYDNGDGNDVIVDYNTGDKISLASGAVSSQSVKGSDVVLKVGKGKITLNNGVDKVITVVDKNGNNRIIGGTKNDNIKGGKGADTLQGGKGNDSLWGGAGNDTFIYANGDGKDTIYGFANDDMLKITGTFSTSCNKSKTEIYFKVGSTANAITLKDFGKTTTFNINSTAYKISGTSLVKDK
ncbi:MAG: calcium-binding protein, partial [Selenomonadaceae bacterium]|nr:calcium-binding protein [Selenomonadaceae bacterium]